LSSALHNKQAKLQPPDTFLSRKNAPKCICGWGSAPDPTGGAYSAPPDPVADNGEGPPGKGEGKGEEGKGRGKEGGEGREGLSP